MHPDVDADAVCSRCGAFVCARCHRLVEGQVLCAGCDERVRTLPPSAAAKLAILLALFGPVGLVPGLVGGGLGWRELHRIRRGEAPASGEGYAVVARAL